MSVWSDLVERLRTVIFRSREERELEEEVAFHLEQEEAKNRAAGLSPTEARRRARVQTRVVRGVLILVAVAAIAAVWQLIR